MSNDVIERVAVALERIADALERQAACQRNQALRSEAMQMIAMGGESSPRYQEYLELIKDAGSSSSS